MESPDCVHRSKRPQRGQLQRFVMNTIRVMARPERANLTAHATKATHRKRLRYPAASPVASPTCEHPIPADSARAITSDCIDDYFLHSFSVRFHSSFVIPMAWEARIPNNVCNAHLSGRTTKAQRELNAGVQAKHARRPK